MTTAALFFGVMVKRYRFLTTKAGGLNALTTIADRIIMRRKQIDSIEEIKHGTTFSVWKINDRYRVYIHCCSVLNVVIDEKTNRNLCGTKLYYELICAAYAEKHKRCNE